MTQTYLQTSESKDNTGNAFLTFASGALASTHGGNLLHLQVSWAGELSPDNVHFTANTITDTQKNKWTFIGVTTGGGHFCAHWYAAKIAGGACTATVNANTGASGITYPDVLLSEVSGVDTLVAHDETLTGSEGAGAIFSSGSMTAPAADLPCLMASYSQDSGVSVLAGPGSGFTSVFVGGNLFGSNCTAIESLVTNTAGAQTANWVSTQANSAGYYIMSVLWCLSAQPVTGGGSESPQHRSRRLQLKPSYPVPAYLDIGAQQIHWSSARATQARPAAKPPQLERVLLKDLPEYRAPLAPSQRTPKTKSAAAQKPTIVLSPVAPGVPAVLAPAPVAAPASAVLPALRTKLHPAARIGISSRGRLHTVRLLHREVEAMEALLSLLNGDAETPAGKA